MALKLTHIQVRSRVERSRRIVVTDSSASGLGSFQRFMNRPRQVADLVGLA